MRSKSDIFIDESFCVFSIDSRTLHSSKFD
jgi:hypothetical protein